MLSFLHVMAGGNSNYIHINKYLTDKRYYSILGVLRGFDQVLNVVLERCHERIFSTTQGVVQNVLGLYMIRGDNMYYY